MSLLNPVQQIVIIHPYIFVIWKIPEMKRGRRMIIECFNFGVLLPDNIKSFTSSFHVVIFRNVTIGTVIFVISRIISLLIVICNIERGHYNNFNRLVWWSWLCTIQFFDTVKYINIYCHDSNNKRHWIWIWICIFCVLFKPIFS